MVSVDKIEKGLANYLDAEFMPQFTKSKVEKMIVGTAATLLISKLDRVMCVFGNNNFVKLIELSDEDGGIDAECILQALKQNIPDEGIEFSVPYEIPYLKDIVLTFHKEDVDKLCDYIMV